MQTGKLVDVLSGHEGPVAGLAFTPSTSHSSKTMLASASWDKNVRRRMYIHVQCLSYLYYSTYSV